MNFDTLLTIILGVGVVLLAIGYFGLITKYRDYENTVNFMCWNESYYREICGLPPDPYEDSNMTFDFNLLKPRLE